MKVRHLDAPVSQKSVKHTPQYINCWNQIMNIRILMISLLMLANGCVGMHGIGLIGGTDPATVKKNIMDQLNLNGYRVTSASNQAELNIHFHSFRVRGDISGIWVNHSSGCVVERGFDYTMDIRSCILLPGAFSAIENARKAVINGYETREDSNHALQGTQ